MIKASFKAFGEKKRDRNETVIIKLNRKYDKKLGSYFTVYENQDILTSGNPLNPLKKIFNDNIRNKLASYKNGIITIYSIRRKGASWSKPQNIVVTKMKLICVGNKKPTTHLPAGLLFQIKHILPK